MSILTEFEIAALATGEIAPQLCEDMLPFAAKVITATVKKLAQGVSVEPFAILHHDDGCFTTKVRGSLDRTKRRTEVVTLDQLQRAVASARVRALTEAAQLCEKQWTGTQCANAISALIGETT